jgi:membrane-associated protease RseP (regulator of RpoE activity)
VKTFLLHGSLFLATCACTCFVFRNSFDGGVIGTDADKWVGSILFSFVVMLILTAHEMGHFLMARAHGVDSSWPYFIPLPLGFGTLGAVIRLRGRIPTRDALVDIGAAGPLCGLLIAIPMLFVGASLSSVERLPEDVGLSLPPAMSLLHLASDFGLWVKSEFFGGVPLEFPRYQFFGDNLLTLFAVRVTQGPLPVGSDLIAHPVFLGAWFGLVVTMLNLLPVGQLDGGHLTHAWYGDRAEALGRRIASGALIAALLFSASWLVWFFLITRVVRVTHPPVERPEIPLSRTQKVIVVVTWVMTGLTFMPIPVSMA